MSWHAIGRFSPGELVGARLQLHHAAQIVAAAGITLLPPREDDSHPNMGWDDGLRALVGRPLPATGSSVALRVDAPALLVVSGAGEVRDEVALDGLRIDDAHAWAASALDEAGEALPASGLERAKYDLPALPDPIVLATPHGDEYAEIGRWLANGHRSLARALAGHDGASEVRCWPHHFDLGALITLETDDEGAPTKTVGVGLSPGDESYNHPYWYVSPWPYPDATLLPKLAAGATWHTQGFTSAILCGDDVAALPADAQRDHVRSFLRDAIDASRSLLDP